MADVKRILVASDLSAHADHAFARALLLAERLQAHVTVLHVVAGEPGEVPEPVRAQVASLVERHRSRHPAEVAIRIVTGRDFVEIIRQARVEAADLVVLGAHGEHVVRDLFLGTTAEKVLRKGDRPVLIVKKVPKGPYRRVLVPVDFSGVGRRALALAARVAPDATFHLLHACDVQLEQTLRRAGAADEDVERYREQRLETAKRELQRFVRESVPEAPSGPGPASITQIVEPGHPASVVSDVARRRRDDLIVIGTHGRSGLPHLLVGSVAERVLREARCDVLAVRPEAFRFELP